MFSTQPKLMTILLVDDDQDDIDFFASILAEVDKSNSVTLLTANNGVEALKALRDSGDNLPDRIFLDINMPLLNGIDTLRKLREDIKLRKIDVTIYSTSPTFLGSDDCKNLGANFWQKPTSVADLTTKLTQMIYN